MSSFRLKVWHIEQICVFELSWGKGRQLTAKLPFPNTLKTHYKRWQSAYMDLYTSREFQESTLRARVDVSGTMATPAVDWRARLAQAEAELTSEFHHWLSSADLLKIRREIASGGQQLIHQNTRSITQPIDVFLTCDSPELERLPWETWEIGTEFAASPIRLVRTPTNIEAELDQRQRQGKMRILAILGDETGLNFQQEQAALKTLSSLADVTFVGWQQGKATDHLLEDIQQAIAAPNGWDILFFAGHSNETNVTGGELTIAPNQTVLLSEITPQLLLAKQQGLQFAIFNSCKGLSIANSLISLGLGQVAIMREPIHNRVAQEFLIRFLRQMATYQDVQDALRSTCQSFKLDKNLTYPSAYLIPSLFRHPDSVPFRLKPFGWKEQVKQWLPTKGEAIALAGFLALSLAPPVQHWLLEQRVLMQAVYRQWTGQRISKPAIPPILLVQIDDRSLQKARITNARPMPRGYVAQIVNQLTTLNANVVGVDFWFDRPHPEDAQLRQALESAIRQQRSWFVFAVQQSDTGEWLMVTPDVANSTWSLQGNGWVPFWYLQPLPWLESTPSPLSYWLATAYRLQTEQFRPNPDLQLPSPSLQQSQDLSSQVKRFVSSAVPVNGEPLMHRSMQLQPVTALSYLVQQHWLQPIIDFSIPPEQIYDSIPAWQLLEQPQAVINSRQLKSLESQIVMITAGGYSEAGAASDGEDNFPVPAAIAYWRSQQNPVDDNRILSGGEAHAYMTHHYLTQRFVIPIPDVWLVLAVIPIGKGLSLLLTQPSRRKWLLVVVAVTFGFSWVSLQLYITANVLIPWLLPVVTVWTYPLLKFVRRNNA